MSPYDCFEMTTGRSPGQFVVEDLENVPYV